MGTVADSMFLQAEKKGLAAMLRSLDQKYSNLSELYNALQAQGLWSMVQKLVLTLSTAPVGG